MNNSQLYTLLETVFKAAIGTKNKKALEKTGRHYDRNLGVDIHALYKQSKESNGNIGDIVHPVNYTQGQEKVVHSGEDIIGLSFRSPTGKQRGDQIYGHTESGTVVHMADVEQVDSGKNKGVKYEEKLAEWFAHFGLVPTFSPSAGNKSGSDMIMIGKMEGKRIGVPLGNNATFFAKGVAKHGPPESTQHPSEVKATGNANIAMGSVMMRRVLGALGKTWEIPDKITHHVLYKWLGLSTFTDDVGNKESYKTTVDATHVYDPEIFKAKKEKGEKNFSGTSSDKHKDGTMVQEYYKGNSFAIFGKFLYGLGSSTSADKASYGSVRKAFGNSFKHIANIGRSFLTTRQRKESGGNTQIQGHMTPFEGEDELRAGIDTTNPHHMVKLAIALGAYERSPHHLENQVPQHIRTSTMPPHPFSSLHDGYIFNEDGIFLIERRNRKHAKRPKHDPANISTDHHKRLEIAIAAIHLINHARGNVTRPNHTHKLNVAERRFTRIRNHASSQIHSSHHAEIHRRGEHEANSILHAAHSSGHTIRTVAHNESQTHLHLTDSFDMEQTGKTLRQLLSEIYSINEEESKEEELEVIAIPHIETDPIRKIDDEESRTLSSYTSATPYKEDLLHITKTKATEKMPSKIITSSFSTTPENIILRHKMIAADKIIQEHEEIKEPSALGRAEGLEVDRANTELQMDKIARAFHYIEHAHLYSETPTPPPVPEFESLPQKEQDRHMYAATQAFYTIVARPGPATTKLAALRASNRERFKT